MSHSFTMAWSPLIPQPTRTNRVLVTGAAGTIGSSFAKFAHTKYSLRLMVRGDERGIDAIRTYGELVSTDLGDLPKLKLACQEIDTVIHLAASPDPSATWSQLLPNNLVGTYNLMVAAKAAGVRRVIYASSIHAVGGYPQDVQVKTTDPVNPGDLYGVSKCFGEALGRYMAEKEGLSVISLRIGAFLTPDGVTHEVGATNMFISPRDMNQMFDRCIEDTRLQWAIFHAISDNAYKRLDITDARELLGYKPQDDAAKLNVKLKDLLLSEKLQRGGLPDSYEKSGLWEDL